MLKVHIEPNILDNELVIIGSRVQLSDDINFSNIIYDTGNDEERLTIHNIPIDLVPNNTYYIRGRLIYSVGLSDWINNTYETLGVNVDEVYLYPITPTRIKLHKIILETDGSNHPTNNFVLKSDFQAPVDNSIIATTWLIEDVLGNPVFYLGNSKTNLTRIFISRVLQKNEVYVVKCRHMLKSNDSTDFTSKVIYTSGTEDFKHIERLAVIGTTIKLTYKIPPYTTNIEYKVFQNNNVILTGNSIPGEINKIDLSTLVDNYDGRVLVQAKATGNGQESEYEYYSLLINDISPYFPHTLPYHF